MHTFLKLITLAVVLGALAGCEKPSPENQMATAESYLQNNDPASAVIELKSALQVLPDSAAARRLLGEAYLLLGQTAAAQKELEQAAQLGAAPGEVQPLLARALLLQGDYDGVHAINAFEESLSPAGSASIHASRGKAWLALANLDAAEQEFSEGLNKDAQSLEVLTGMAWLAAQRQQPEQAKAQLDEVFAIDPDYAEAWSLLAGIERTQGNLEAALSAYTRAVDNRRDNAFDRLQRVAVNLALGNNAAAGKEIADLRRQGIGAYLLDYLDGRLSYQEERYSEAINSFEKALNGNPNHALSLFYAGISALETGQLQTAGNYLTRYNAQDPGYLPVLRALAWIEMQNGDFAAAEEYLRTALARDPDDLASLNLLASALDGDQRSGESMEVLHQLVELSPDSAAAKSRLGRELIRQGQLEPGLELLESANAIDPGAEDTALTIVFTHLNNNELDKALAAALKMREANPESVVAAAALGTTYLKREEYDKATEAFEATLELDDDNITAQSGLASLAVQAGRSDDAKAIYRNILKQHPDNMSTAMNLAYLLAIEGSVDEMQTVLTAAIAASPGALAPRLALGRYHGAQGDYASVIDVLAPLEGNAGTNFEYMRMLSEARYRAGDFAGARDNLATLAEQAPDSAEIQYMLAITLGKLGDQPGKQSRLEQVLKLDPGHIGARNELIKLLIAQGDTAAAREQLDSLRKQSENPSEVLPLEGALASASGDYKAAISAYQRAFELAETNFNLLQLETAVWDSGDQQGALTLLENWLEKIPGDQLSRLRLADRYESMGRTADAEKLYLGLLEELPENTVVLNNLAWILRDADRKRALDYAEQAHAIAPGSAAVSDTLAFLLASSDNQRAQALIRDALKSAPNNPDYLYHLGFILSEAGQRDEARRVLEKLLDKHSNFRSAGNAQQLLSQLEG